MTRSFALMVLAGLLSLNGWSAHTTAADDRPAAAKPADKLADPHRGLSAGCAKVCGDCLVMCERNCHHCCTQVADGKKGHTRAMRLSADTAECCAVSAKLAGRHSELAAAACEVCAKACDLCATECDKFADEPDMKACCEACKKCAASCREMAKTGGQK